MTRKCSVPGCRSNYDGSERRVTTFKFPKDSDLRSKWTRSINRKDYIPGKFSYVCEKHFDPSLIIREDRATRPDGTLIVVKRAYPTLVKDAFPTIFPGQPSYLSTKFPTKRKAPDEREVEIAQRNRDKLNKMLKLDEISSFEQLCISISNKVEKPWIKVQRSNYLLFFKIDETTCPKIFVSFKIKETLEVEIFRDHNPISSKFACILGKELKCDKWSKLERLINNLNQIQLHEIGINDKLTMVSNLLTECANEELCPDEKHVSFVKEQIQLIMRKHRNYSPDMIVFACSLFYTSPSCYKMIRDSKYLRFPHPSYLRKLALNVGSPSSGIQTCHKKYLMQKCHILKDEEKLVNILLDEIYIKPRMSYKGGKVEGYAENSATEATSVQAFMISSIFSKNRDIAALFPVKNLNATFLLELTKQIIQFVHSCGYQVLSLISDNNRINRNMFEMLCGGELKPYFENPCIPDKPIFVLFDTVHLLKSVRNNCPFSLF